MSGSNEDSVNRLQEILAMIFGKDEIPEDIEINEMMINPETGQIVSVEKVDTTMMRQPDEEQTHGTESYNAAVQQALADTTAQAKKAPDLLKTEVTTENIEKSVVTSLPTVVIDTPAFKTTAYGLYDLPGMKVMHVLAMSEGEKMQGFVDMFKLAMLEPAKIDELEYLSFNELGDVLSQWMERSAPEMPTTARIRRR